LVRSRRHPGLPELAPSGTKPWLARARPGESEEQPPRRPHVPRASGSAGCLALRVGGRRGRSPGWLRPPGISHPQRSGTETARGAPCGDSLATDHVHGEPQGFLDGFGLALQEREQVGTGRERVGLCQPTAALRATAAAPPRPGAGSGHLSTSPRAPERNGAAHSLHVSRFHTQTLPRDPSGGLRGEPTEAAGLGAADPHPHGAPER